MIVVRSSYWGGKVRFRKAHDDRELRGQGSGKSTGQVRSLEEKDGRNSNNKKNNILIAKTLHDPKHFIPWSYDIPGSKGACKYQQ